METMTLTSNALENKIYADEIIVEYDYNDEGPWIEGMYLDFDGYRIKLPEEWQNNHHKEILTITNIHHIDKNRSI